MRAAQVLQRHQQIQDLLHDRLCAQRQLLLAESAPPPRDAWSPSGPCSSVLPLFGGPGPGSQDLPLRGVPQQRPPQSEAAQALLQPSDLMRLPLLPLSQHANAGFTVSGGGGGGDGGGGGGGGEAADGSPPLALPQPMRSYEFEPFSGLQLPAFPPLPDSYHDSFLQHQTPAAPCFVAQQARPGNGSGGRGGGGGGAFAAFGSHRSHVQYLNGAGAGITPSGDHATFMEQVTISCCLMPTMHRLRARPPERQGGVPQHRAGWVHAGIAHAHRQCSCLEDPLTASLHPLSPLLQEEYDASADSELARYPF